MKGLNIRDLWTIVDQHEDLSYRDDVETPTHDRDWEYDDHDEPTACVRNGEYDGDLMTDDFPYG